MRNRFLHSALATTALLTPTLTIALATFVLPGRAAAQENPAVGTWTGNLAVGGPGLTLVFHFEADDEGGLTGTLDSPDQGATGIAIDEVTATGDSVKVRILALGVEFDAQLTENGDTLSGQFRQGGVSLPLTLSKGEPPERQPRPQEPEPPLPYDTEDVTFQNEPAGISLAGTLTLPRTAGPHPAAVLVSGSGGQDRDESLMNHKPFLVLADHLTRNGIAVLRFDDRGIGESGGVFATATTEDFVTDALAAVRYLKARPEIDGSGMGIIGHSEGGLVGPLAATRSDDVAFVVMLAGPGVPGDQILLAQIEAISRASGLTEERIGRSLRAQERIHAILMEDTPVTAMQERLQQVLRAAIDSASDAERAAIGSPAQVEQYVQTQIRQVTSPWFRHFLRYDPRPALEAVNVPVLALIGSLDLQVPADQNLPEIEAALRRGGNPDATVSRLPGLNHLFQTAMTGAPAEYTSIEETISPSALSLISGWIGARFLR